MNIKSNFKRNTNIIAKYCIKSYKKEIDNENLIYCSEVNGDSEVQYEYILNIICMEVYRKLDGVGPVENRPSTD